MAPPRRDAPGAASVPAPTPAGDPLVSVVIPTYNQAGFLREAIDSVLAQTYPQVELIVVDDGSTDETPGIIATYGQRLVALHQPNRGAANALNAGIRAARGDLICWLSSDDAYLPPKLERQVAAFAADPSAGMCCTGWTTVDATGAVLRSTAEPAWIHPDPVVSIFWRNPINGTTVMIPRRVFDEVGLFNEELVADVDGEMWLRIAARHRIVTIPEILARYRVHAAAMSRDTDLMHASKIRVRLPVVRDGTLATRIRDHAGEKTPAILATIGQDMVRQGLPELAQALQDASLQSGVATGEQTLLARALGVGAPGSVRGAGSGPRGWATAARRAIARIPGVRQLARAIRRR